MKRARDGQEAAHEEEHREHPEENVTESDQKSVTKETEPQEQSPKDESSENTKTQPETSSAKSGSAPPSTAPLPTVAHDGPPGTQPQQQQTLTPEEWAKMTPEQQQQYQMAIQQTMRYQQEMWMRMTPDQREQYSTWFQQQQQWAYYVSYMAQRSAAIAQQTAARLATLRPDPEAAPPPQFKQYEASAQFNSRTGRFQGSLSGKIVDKDVRMMSHYFDVSQLEDRVVKKAKPDPSRKKKKVPAFIREWQREIKLEKLKYPGPQSL